MNFYDNYISLCNRAGKSPSAVAIEIGLTKPTVNRWKNGSRPTDATIRRVADYFNVPISDLKGTLNLDDMTYMIAKENGMTAAVALLTQEETKKPAGQKADGLRGLGYYDLTPENQKMIDALIDSLLKSQSGEQ